MAAWTITRLAGGTCPVRVGEMRPEQPSTATVLLVPGRGDSLELRRPVAERLARSGFATVMVEHRGQGGSGHLGAHADAVHVDSFDTHLVDIARVADRLDGTVHLIAHSMGGLLAAIMLSREPSRFASATLSSPMWDFAGPLPTWATRTIAAGARSAGLSQRFAPGERPFDLDRCVHMRCSTRPELAPPELSLMAAEHRDLVRGGSTWGWVHAATRMIARLDRAPLDAVTCPVTIASCLRDHTVSLSAHRRVARRFRRARVIELDCGHDPFFAPPVVREQWWSAIDASLRSGDDAEADTEIVAGR